MAKRTSRQKVVHVRMSETEFLAFEAFCADVNLTVSEALRRLVRQAAGLGPAFDGDLKEIVLAHAEELRRVGVNLNQIARALNGGREPRFEALLDGVVRLARVVGAQASDIKDMCEAGRAKAQLQVNADA
ncbi:plasmid mobilization relaxosome protein MobC (plasmid) [Rhizobium sp. CB3060]|uniref:plasmid mobilization relaxosome protein MobC n=1 Tax=Rhizobium sp. CB3060 TaxID=3138255 RepID=UPI0021A448C5|nr:plasmid mobilization relaxosome protein MobC [Rhizobium tropici]UWU26018.1 plasmid mobilization relaxosome protein MobC [Rhizobium tropici]